MTTPSGRVPLTGALAGTAASAMAFSPIVDEMRGEMQHALESFEGHVVMGLCFADARSEDKTKFASARFFVRMHEGDQPLGWHVGPRGKQA